jgi:hypothetical protein
MGRDDVVKVNLTTLKADGSFVVGDKPSHPVISSSGGRQSSRDGCWRGLELVVLFGVDAVRVGF